MAQQLGILVALPNELDSIPSTHTTPHNCLRGSNSLFWPLRALNTSTQTYMQAKQQVYID